MFFYLPQMKENEGKWRKMNSPIYTQVYWWSTLLQWRKMKENEFPYLYTSVLVKYFTIRKRRHLVHPGTVIYVECINIPINRLQWGWPPQIGKLGAVSKILFSFFLFFSHIITFWHFGIFSKLNIQAKAYISHPIICCSKNVENISFTLYCDRQQQCRCCWINRR